MTGPVLDPLKMNRLAFIRLLYRQAVEQSQQPRPLSAASILMFHDTAEQFLILAAEHLQASGVKRVGLLQYWDLLKPRRDFNGVELSGQHGISRLNSVRNDLKHLGAMPSQEDIDDARSAVAGFLDDNTPKVFGVEFSEVGLADMVPQEEVRAKLKSAAAAEAAGERKEAMADLAKAVTGLLNDRLNHVWESRYKFGQAVNFPYRGLVGPTVARLAVRLPRPHQQRAAKKAATELDGHLRALSEATSQMQRGLRVLALGIDYAQYVRFEQLTPLILSDGGARLSSMSLAWAPTREEYEDCVQFVITAALHLAELEARSAPPSWLSP
jgi:hypothetical protein